MADRLLVIASAPAAEGLTERDVEALGLGQQLAAAAGLGLDCAVLGADVDAAAQEAAERGAERVLIVTSPSLATFDGDTVVAATAAAFAPNTHRVVIVARSEHVLDVAPRLAARIDGGLVIGALECAAEPDGALRLVAPAFGGAVRATYRLPPGRPQLIVPAVKAAPPPQREVGRSAERVTLTAELPPSRVSVVTRPEAAGARLEDARVVVSGGRGLREAENYGLVRELAEALGGMPGASRAIVDLGWASPAEQVGLTGKIVAPDVYLALGISGASQHMMGCSNARTLIAVNTDPDAPIFQHAHYGVVGDALALLPELIRLARTERS